jgi:hypothetical protein
MTIRLILGMTLCTVATSCTHHQLTQSTVLTTSTVTDIQYRIVLMNLALLSCHPEALPSHIDLAEGVIQVNDEAGFGGAGGFTTFNGTRFGIEQLGPSVSRKISEQWGADATTDPRRLVELRDLYRVALGMPTLPPPNAIAYLRRIEAEKQKEKKREEEDGEEDSNNDSSDEDRDERVPIEVLLTDVPPPGWYHLGAKKDVPKTACYVGRYGDRYAWVMADGMPSLSQFTVTAMMIVKLDPVRGQRSSRGLAVTR